MNIESSDRSEELDPKRSEELEQGGGESPAASQEGADQSQEGSSQDGANEPIVDPELGSQMRQEYLEKGGQQQLSARRELGAEEDTQQAGGAQSSAHDVQLERLESGVAVLSLAPADARMVVFTKEKMESLKSTLEELHQNPPDSLVITGPSEKMFCFGADITAIRGVTDEAVGQELSKQGQEVFNLVADLPCKTVAAISGPCAGGGCELALACDTRIASDSPSTKIGLPETQLGILPGWGGTQRLPRVVGLPNALSIMLKGKLHSARDALKLHLVDEVVPTEKLRERAEEVAQQGGKAEGFLHQIKLAKKWGAVGTLATHLGNFRKKAEAQAKKAIPAGYPAPVKAVDAAIFGLEKGMDKGLALEAQMLGELVASSECKSLVHLYFAGEAAKELGKGAKAEMANVEGVVVGAGAMGAGIAGALVGRGDRVVLKDLSEEQLEKASERIVGRITGKRSPLSEEQKAEYPKNLLTASVDTAEVVERLKGSNFAIEAIAEVMPLKQKVLGALAEQIEDDAIIAARWHI